MGYTYSAIAQPKDFLCTWRIKLPGRAFVLKKELLTKYTDWKEGEVLKST